MREDEFLAVESLPIEPRVGFESVEAQVGTWDQCPFDVTPWASWLWNDPMRQAFASMAERDLTARIDWRRPENVLGERSQMLLYRCLQHGREKDKHTPEAYELRGKIAVSGVSTALEAVPFLVTDEAWEVAIAMDVPAAPLSRTTLPYPLIWLAFESHGNIAAEGQSMTNIMLRHGRDSIMLEMYMAKTRGDAGGQIQQMLVWAYRLVYGEDWRGEGRDWLAGVMAFFAMVNSPHIGLREAVLPRGLRRRNSRVSPTGSESSTSRSVYLLKLDPPKAVARHPEHGAGRDWQHRWAVRGHIRNQWYPSAGEHRLIWIPPYVKGPPHKPFRSKVYAK